MRLKKLIAQQLYLFVKTQKCHVTVNMSLWRYSIMPWLGQRLRYIQNMCLKVTRWQGFNIYSSNTDFCVHLRQCNWSSVVLEIVMIFVPCNSYGGLFCFDWSHFTEEQQKLSWMKHYHIFDELNWTLSLFYGRLCNRAGHIYFHAVVPSSSSFFLV